jgi:hypothetical protein
VLTPGKLITRFGVPIEKKDFENLSVEEIRDLVRDRIQLLIQA